MIKNERIKVILTREIVDSILAGIVVPLETSHRVSLPAKLSAAKALLRKPASVIATWTEAMNLAGWRVRERIRFAWFARRPPEADIFSSLFLLSEIRAISAQVKKALIVMRTRSKRSCHKNGSPLVMALIHIFPAARADGKDFHEFTIHPLPPGVIIP